MVAPQPLPTSDTAAAPQSAWQPSFEQVPALVAAIGAAAAALVLVLVPAHEGTVYRGYRDIGGVVTACTGHTRTAVLGRRYTAQDCAELLASDLVVHARELHRCITVPMLPHQAAALLSLMFNVGAGRAGEKDGLCELKRGGPSTIVRLANAGDWPGACAAISAWTFVRGRDCASDEWRRWCGGIVTRRAAERAMCEGRYVAGAAPAAGEAP